MAKVTKKTARKAKLVGKTTRVGVCGTWLVAFQRKTIKTAAQCTAFMRAEFPGRDSAVFGQPNMVIGRANRGLLDGKKHDFKKYPKQLDKTKAQS
jgi:hypothetical protein